MKRALIFGHYLYILVPKLRDLGPEEIRPGSNFHAIPRQLKCRCGIEKNTKNLIIVSKKFEF
jgi:hypothetical protein